MQKSISRTRQAIAELAAQYIAEDGLISYYAAKRKAADQLGFKQKDLPTNIEIERAVISYQTLFQNSFQPEELFKLRMTAIDVMSLFEHFYPRLAGPVLAGTAGSQSEIIVHLFSDNPEAISSLLMVNDIPYKNSERRIRMADKNTVTFPAYCFLAGHMSVVLILFPEKQLNQAPVCPIDEKPMKRANIKKVQSLVQESR
jgi:hypothetical protein